MLKLYHREECHLCELALDLLAHNGFSERLKLIDIDTDPTLGIEFGLRIPVLEREDGTRLDWPFTKSDLNRFFALT